MKSDFYIYRVKIKELINNIIRGKERMKLGKEEVNKRNISTVKSTVKKGISFGSCLAIVISYTAWKSIPWAIFHGLMSWVYVFYYWVKYI